MIRIMEPLVRWIGLYIYRIVINDLPHRDPLTLNACLVRVFLLRRDRKRWWPKQRTRTKCDSAFFTHTIRFFPGIV